MNFVSDDARSKIGSNYNFAGDRLIFFIRIFFTSIMSGLVKAKTYDWQDSNLALFGSDTEKQVKKEAAETEPAWQGAGQKVGLQIWRINNFRVEHWPTADYGKFYNGDSYIILNTYKEKESDELLYDVHFWIGKHSTQDEYGTAAYKTVELDTFLDDKPVQHREVEGHESALFKTYFKSYTLMDGGAASGFRHVTPEEYKPRLLKVSGDKKRVQITEVEFCLSNITDDDVFIIDKGNNLYLFHGCNSIAMEKYQASTEIQKIKNNRGKATSEVVTDLHNKCFNDIPENPSAEVQADDEPDNEDISVVMLRLSDSSGQLLFTEIPNDGTLSRKNLSPEDVFILDTGCECFVWVGSGASEAEKHNGMKYAHDYLNKTNHPLVPVTIVPQGKETKAFMSATVA